MVQVPARLTDGGCGWPSGFRGPLTGSLRSPASLGAPTATREKPPTPTRRAGRTGGGPKSQTAKTNRRDRTNRRQHRERIPSGQEVRHSHFGQTSRRPSAHHAQPTLALFTDEQVDSQRASARRGPSPASSHH
jgi:hypothetical protein